MKLKPNVFRFLCGVAAAYHLLLAGAAFLLPPELLSKVLSGILGVAPSMEGDLPLVATFAGAYVLAFGVGLALLSRHPRRYRALVPGVLVLFGVRLLNRVLLFSSLAERYELSAARNLFGVLSLALLFAGIWLTAPKKADA